MDDRSAPDEFVSEPITPEPGSFAPDLMVQGLAALPGAFTWRGRRYEVVECLSHVKQSEPEGHSPSGERYLRRQEFDVVLDTGQRARIYMQRGKKRWFLLTISSSGQARGDAGDPRRP